MPDSGDWKLNLHATVRSMGGIVRNDGGGLVAAYGGQIVEDSKFLGFVKACVEGFN